MRKSLLTTMPAADTAQEPAVKAKPIVTHNALPDASAKDKTKRAEMVKEWAVTTIRFKPNDYARLRKIAIDRKSSIQEMIEQGLALLLSKEGWQAPKSIRS